jgi:hypothetical protein
MVPDFLHEAPPTDACAAFIKESRMEFADARRLNRKSGCTLGRTWGTRPEPRTAVPEPCLRDLVWKNVRTKRTMRTKSVESPDLTGEEAV